MEENKAQVETVAEARATLRYARISARKVKIVADLLRGKSVEEALGIVKYAPKASAEILEKLLKSIVYSLFASISEFKTNGKEVSNFS